MRLHNVTGAVLAVLVLSGCNGLTTTPRDENGAPSPSSVTRVAAVRLAFQSPSLPSGQFSPVPGSSACTIVGGGPYPGLHVPATCSTAAVPGRAGSWAVTFTETWDAALFHLQGEPPSGQLSHSWAFTVAADGTVTFDGESGSLTPQAAL